MVEQTHIAQLSAGAPIQNPDSIIVHALAEYIVYNGKSMHAVDYLKFAGLSAHALITMSGVTIRCRRDDQGAYHAKKFNTNSLGIELLVPGRHDYESFLYTINNKDYLHIDAYLAAIRQVKSWVEKYSISIDKIKRHSDVDPDRKQDPGNMFPWEAFIEALGI